MKTKAVVILSVGIFVALSLSFYPRWEWHFGVDSGYDVIYAHASGFAFLWSPPAPDARIDQDRLFWQLIGVGVGTIGSLSLLYLFAEKRKEQKTANYWRQKWERTSLHSDTLLRVGSAPQEPATTLLRAAQTENTTPSEQLLRPGERRQ
jgi:hypothetical protein